MGANGPMLRRLSNSLRYDPRRMSRAALGILVAVLFAPATPAPAAATDAPHGDGPATGGVAVLLEKARVAATQVRFPTDRAEAHRAVARAQAASGDRAGARASLVAAREAVADYPYGFVRAQVYWETARDQIDIGDAAGAAVTRDAGRKTAYHTGPPGERRLAYGELAIRRSWLHDAAGAKADFDAALEAARNDGPTSRDSSIRWVVEAMARAGRIDEAEAVAEKIGEDLWRSLAFTEVAAARAGAGDLAAARKMAERIPAGYLRVDAHKAMAEACARVGDVDGAISVADAIADADGVESAYATIVEVVAEAGNAAGAKAVAARARWQDRKAEAFTSLALVLARTGDAAGAKASAAVAFAALSKDDPRWWRVRRYARLGEAQGLAGDAAGARASFAAARAAADEIDASDERDWREASWKWTAMADIATAQANAGDLGAAKVTLADIQGSIVDSYKAPACHAVAGVEARRGNVAGLTRWIEDLPEPLCRAYAYAGAAETLSENHRPGAPAH